jgi:hypothetical protein
MEKNGEKAKGKRGEERRGKERRGEERRGEEIHVRGNWVAMSFPCRC